MDEKKQLIPQNSEPTTDLSSDDLTKVLAYKEAGMPGLAALEPPKMQKIMDLYLDGKSYRQISNIVRVDKTLIMYMSDRFNWYMMRREYLNELEARQRHEILEAKLEDKNTLLNFTHMFRRKFNSNITKYLQTDDERFANEIDLKELDRYLKIIDVVHKLGYDGKESKPAVGLNLGEGVTIKKTGDNEVEITPKQKTIADALKQFADMRREEEEKKKRPDMIELPKGESNDNQ